MRAVMHPLHQYFFMAWCLIKHKETLILSRHMRLEVFVAMNIQVAVLWVVTPCSEVVGYQLPICSCCHLLENFTLKIEAACHSETLVFYHFTIRYHNPGDRKLSRYSNFLSL
jgi:hypothetical protein